MSYLLALVLGYATVLTALMIMDRRSPDDN